VDRLSLCQLHRGITEGILAEAVSEHPDAEVKLECFSSLVDVDPCRMEVSISA
jgi:hypothetical protein